MEKVALPLFLNYLFITYILFAIYLPKIVAISALVIVAFGLNVPSGYPSIIPLEYAFLILLANLVLLFTFNYISPFL